MNSRAISPQTRVSTGVAYFESRFPARRFAAQKFLAIFCRTSSTHATEDLRKMLLGFEATGHGYIHACARIFCGKTNGDSDPLIERWKRPRDLDTFSNQLRRDHFVRLSGLEEYEISPGIRAAAPERVEQRVSLLSLFNHFQSHSVHVAGVSQTCGSGCQREPVEAVRGANAVAFQGSGKPFRCDRIAHRHSGQPVDLSESPVQPRDSPGVGS